ncbi:MAG: DUF6666 family protein [Planctomycetota bacterium]
MSAYLKCGPAFGPQRVRCAFTLLAATLFGVGMASNAAHGQGLKWRSNAEQQAVTQYRSTGGASQAGFAAEFVEPVDGAPDEEFIGPPKPKRATQAAYSEPTAAAPKRPTYSASNPPRRVASAIRTSVPQASPSDLGGDFAAAVERAMTAPVAGRQASQNPGVRKAGFVGNVVGYGYGHGVDCGCGCCGEPGCAVAEPMCGIPEPTCGYVEPGCGCVGPTCECPPVIEGPVCGDVCGDCICGEVGCGGACAGAPCPPSFGGCDERGAIPLYIYLPPIKEIILFGGVHGFRGPLDFNPGYRDAGNFGFHEGINVGGRMSWLPLPGLGYQIGYQATHSQLSGDSSVGGGAHTQSFFTAGLFKRCPVGWQYGVVYDLLEDERQASTDFSQVRGQISYINHCRHEWGFEFASHTNEELIGGRLYQGAEQYRLFFRRQGRSGGEFKGFIGSSSDNHVILGGELFAPLDHRWSIQTGFTYFVPTGDGDGLTGSTGPGTGMLSPAAAATEEAWNIGINLVWHYGARGKQWYRTPWRPLFNVADNGSFVIDDAD